MDQIVGTSKIHTFRAYDNLGAEVTTLTDPVVKYRVNGGEKTTLSTPTISAYDSDMRDFLLTVPDTLAVNPYNTISISVTATEGTADLLIDVVPPPSLIATAVWEGTDGAAVVNDLTDVKAITDLLTLAAINAECDTALTDYDAPTKTEMDSAFTEIKGATWTTETLESIQATADLGATAIALGTAQDGITAIQAVTDTVAGEFDATNGLIGAISIGTSVGAEKVIPAAYYSLDASEKTITLSSPYDTVTVEQILSIFDLTTGSEIYNCLTPRKRRSFNTGDDAVGIDITVATGVITYIEDATGIADTDKIMIVVNTP